MKRIRHSKRGQGAVEYITSYGWALLVVIVIGVIFYGLGIFDSRTPSITTSGFPKIRPVVTATKLDRAGNFAGTFVNGAGVVITLVSVNLTDSLLSDNNNCVYTPPTPIQISGGDGFIANCTIPGYSSTQKQTYSLQTIITYTVTMSGSTTMFNDVGIISGPLEAA
ncbi:Uncharacterised protein [uncultured archaeon]|nr:Uncharacterised protein [uncultured archaeon]